MRRGDDKFGDDKMDSDKVELALSAFDMDNGAVVTVQAIQSVSTSQIVSLHGVRGDYDAEAVVTLRGGEATVIVLGGGDAIRTFYADEIKSDPKLVDLVKIANARRRENQTQN